MALQQKQQRNNTTTNTTQHIREAGAYTKISNIYFIYLAPQPLGVAKAVYFFDFQSADLTKIYRGTEWEQERETRVYVRVCPLCRRWWRAHVLLRCVFEQASVMETDASSK